MTSFCPDLNVWLALSVSAHPHSARAWRWVQTLQDSDRLYFSRYTHLGLLRLLTHPSVMANHALSLGTAWSVYDHWLEDPRVEFHPEPSGLDAVFRDATKRFGGQTASKIIGDCYLLAFARHTRSALVTFDAALHRLAERHGADSLMPESERAR